MQPATLPQMLDEALLRHHAGRLDEAENLYRRILQIEPGNAHVLNLLGVLANQNGRHEIALDFILQAIARNPHVPSFHISLGNALRGQARLDEAIAAYQRALAQEPGMAAGHGNLGAALAELGRLEEAAAALERAVALEPARTEWRSNLATILLELGRLDEALVHFRHILNDTPHSAETHNNLGAALLSLGKVEDAAAAFRQALKLKPDFGLAACNLALLMSGMGQHKDALNVVTRALAHAETIQAKRTFAACAQHVSWRGPDLDMHRLLTRAVDEAWGRPSDLAPAAIALLLCDPDLRSCVTHISQSWPSPPLPQEMMRDRGFRALAADRLLRALLVATPICDLGLERLLTQARRILLEQAGAGASCDGLLDFFGALARQCFINDYVYFAEPDQLRQAHRLRDVLVATLDANGTVSPQALMAVAAYFPLSSLPGTDRLLKHAFPDCAQALLDQQIREPQEELRDRSGIPRLTGIQNPTSLLVQKQYEESPYPRWVRMPVFDKPDNLVRYLSYKFPLAGFDRTAQPERVRALCAGCGTGQQAIETSRHFQVSNILAIDLSMDSLAYARRKARELGITSIAFAQADILNLDDTAPSFDVIECVGVLHHLEDPWAGWRRLSALLRPGGFMKIGLYSEMGRGEIKEIRRMIAQQAYAATPDGIRRFRKELMDSDSQAVFRTITRAEAFYSLNMCRDMLFHVQEHRLNLAGVADFLRENGLRFLGFDIDSDTLARYRRRFPLDPAALDFSHWQRFEASHPETFGAMYNFWIQKPVAQR